MYRKSVLTPKETKYAEAELVDGSVIRCAKFLIKGKKFVPELLPGPADVPAPKLELPLTSVFHVLRGAEDPKNRDAWKAMLLNRGKRDLYVIRGTGGLNFVQGTLIEGNAAGDEVTFEQENGQPEKLRLSRASGGLVFNQPPQTQIPPTLCRVNDVFGNSLVAQSVELAGGGVRVKTVAGVEVSYPSAAAVAALDYGQGNIAYLSNLEPLVAAPEREAGEPRFTYVRDRNQLGEGLRLDNVGFPKGLWVYTDTTLTFNLGGDYREFKAVLGMDDSLTNATSAAKVTIEADNQVLFAGTVKRTDKPRPLAVWERPAPRLREYDIEYPEREFAPRPASTLDLFKK